MNTDPTSLDRLHDIVVPSSAPWFPPAAAWWPILTILFFILLAVAWKRYLIWKSNAYRRAAVTEYARLSARPGVTVREYSELLRRAALASGLRTSVTGLIGKDWIQWLEETGGVPVPEKAAFALTVQLYKNDAVAADVELAAFVRTWIRKHGTENKTESADDTGGDKP